MATDLFNQYYNNPTKSYIYADIICSNASSADEISFDINDSAGQITSNDDILSSIDLSEIHVPASQYMSDVRTIDPNGYCYIKGFLYGDAYCQKAYGRIIGEITEDEDWMFYGMIFFAIRYLDRKTGNIKTEFIKAQGNPDEEKTFIDVINEYFEKQEIPIVVSFDDGYVIFTATILAYEFWIDHVLFWKSEEGMDIFYYVNQWMIENGKSYEYGWDDGFVTGNNMDSSSLGAVNLYSSILKRSDYSRLYNLFTCLEKDFNDILMENDVHKIYLYEDFTKYVPSKLYKNGAMKGIIMSVVYPQYNADSITEFQKAVKVAHLVDRVQEFYAIPESLVEGTFTGVRKLIDVSDMFHCEYDHELYNKWMGFYSHHNVNDDWIYADEIPQVIPKMLEDWEESAVSFTEQGKSIYKDIEHRETMGLEGYCAYLSHTKQWMTVGQFYARTTISDDPEHPETRNLIPSVIIYNPNNFPVQVKYMAFA